MSKAFSFSWTLAVCLLSTWNLDADEPATDADGETKYAMAYRFRTGQSLRWEVVTQQTVKTTLQGVTKTAHSRSESVKVWNVTGVSPSGGIQMVNSVESLKMSNQVADRPQVEYDSQTDKQPPPQWSDVPKSIGVPLTEFRLDPQGRILSREDKMPQAAPAGRGPITLILPDEPVPVGHVWNAPLEVRVPAKNGNIKTIQTRQRMELEGVKHGVATIAVANQVLTPLDDPYLEAQLIQRLGNGSVRFDIEAGHIISQQIDVDKRVVGFSGPTSSLHHVMRRSERLLKPNEKVARKP